MSIDSGDHNSEIGREGGKYALKIICENRIILNFAICVY